MKVVTGSVLIGLMLCSCIKQLYDHNDNGEPNYMRAYLIDTVSILNPIKIVVKERGMSASFM